MAIHNPVNHPHMGTQTMQHNNNKGIPVFSVVMLFLYNSVNFNQNLFQRFISLMDNSLSLPLQVHQKFLSFYGFYYILGK